MIGGFLKHTLKSPADGKDPRPDLVHANLAGLPPVTIVNAEIDPPREDAAQPEAALTRAGGPVERRLYGGVAHEFFGMGAAVTASRARSARRPVRSSLRLSAGRVNHGRDRPYGLPLPPEAPSTCPVA